MAKVLNVATSFLDAKKKLKAILNTTCYARQRNTQRRSITWTAFRPTFCRR
jgi:hypothetical protein